VNSVWDHDSVTSAVLTPWWRTRFPVSQGSTAAGSVGSTQILDVHDPRVASLIDEVRRHSDDNDTSWLRTAHAIISEQIRPVYSLDDEQSVSKTIARGRGSCSQRLAILETVARGSGIRTRVRGLLIDGRFWYPRFRHFRFLVPNEVLLAWPEFFVNGDWIDTSEVFGGLRTLAADADGGFSNAGGETLFEAISRTAVDWDGRTSDPGTCSVCDLSSTLLRDLGRYDSRDELFAQQGQTLSRAARVLAEPFLGRWSADTTETSK
jgi:hypothetical protein